MALLAAGLLFAAVTTVPNSDLLGPTGYYTDQIGGVIGAAVAMNNPGGTGSTHADDGYNGPINLGYSLPYYGTTYTQFYANINGNITFGSGVPLSFPAGAQAVSIPMIAPFLGDVDTTNSGAMYVRTMADQVIVTWDQVPYAPAALDNHNVVNSFQLVLRSPNYPVPPLEGQVGFFYKSINWETAASNGGLDDGVIPPAQVGFPANMGFADGLGNGVVLAASGQSGLRSVLNAHHIWFNLPGGNPTPAPVVVASGVPALNPWAFAVLGIAILGLGQYMLHRRAPGASRA